MNDILQVGSARAAAAFEHPQSRRLVLGLVAKEQSLQELVDPAGVQRMNRMRGPSSRLRAFEAWSALSLVPQEAEKLAADLRALLARYGRRSGGGAHPFIAYCAFARRKQAPMPEHRRDR